MDLSCDLVRITIDKSAYHQLSQNEIGSDKPSSRHLSLVPREFPTSALIGHGLVRAPRQSGATTIIPHKPTSRYRSAGHNRDSLQVAD